MGLVTTIDPVDTVLYFQQCFQMLMSDKVLCMRGGVRYEGKKEV